MATAAEEKRSGTADDGVERAELFRWRRRHRRQIFDGNRDGVFAPQEAAKGRPDVPEEPDPRVRPAEVRGEFPVRLEGHLIVLTPCLERGDQFVGLLWLDRQHCASAERVDRHTSQPVELEAMTAWDVVQPAMRIFEIVRLEAQRRYHRRYVQISNRLPGRVSEFDVSHENLHPPDSRPGPE